MMIRSPRDAARNHRPGCRLGGLLLLLLAGLTASASTLSPVPIDPEQVLLRYNNPEFMAFGEATIANGLYLLGSLADERPAEVSLWRFDGDNLARLRLPGVATEPSLAWIAERPPTKPGGLFPPLQESFFLQGHGDELFVKRYRYDDPTPQFWWSDGFTVRALSPHPALAGNGLLRWVGDDTYWQTDTTLWLLDGAADRLTALAEAPPGERFHDLGQVDGELIVWTRQISTAGTTWRVNQWVLRDGTLQALAALSFVGRPTDLVQVSEHWYLAIEEGGLWLVENGEATPVAGIHAADDLAVIGDSLYLSATTGASGREPYRVEGDTATPLGDLRPGPDSSFPHPFLPCGERVCFTAQDTTGESLWWVSDGDGAAWLGERMLFGIAEGKPYNGALYLIAEPADSAGRALYRSDGETVTEVFAGCGELETPRAQWVIGTSLYIRASGCDGPTDLYRLSDPVTPLVNLSVNTGLAAGGSPLTPGFIVTGNGGRFALLGESQTSADQQPLPDPILTVRDLASGEILAENDDWWDHPDATEVEARVRPPNGPRDAALVLSLAPGSYIAELRDRDGRAGQALLSIQQIDGMRELINISANTRVPPGGIIPGFVVQGEGGRFVVFGEAQPRGEEPLIDPRITVRHLISGAVLGENDDWRDHPTAAEVQAQVRAPMGEHDAALALSLPPGSYVVELRDGEGKAGQALLSVQQIPGD